MKKLMVFILALSLFAACNNDKKENSKSARDKSEREKDDYRTEDDKKSKDEEDDEKTVDYSDKSGGWSSVERDAFLSNCISQGKKDGAIPANTVSSYCNCMLDYIEDKYPNPIDAAGINMQDEEFLKKAMQCLGMK